MEDSQRCQKQKLLAAKKKLREYKNKRSGNKEGVADSETLTNSTHSSLNGNVDEDFTSNTDDHSKSPLQNYFNSNITEEYNNTTVSFFDGCAHATAFNETATAYDRETSASDGTPTTVAFVDLTKESHQQEYLTENAPVNVDREKHVDEPSIHLGTEYPNQLHSYGNEFNSATIYAPQQVQPTDENNHVLYKDTSSPFDSDVQQNRLDYESRLRKDLEPLQQQLEYHAQTIGILVAEKTELSTELSQSLIINKQKIGDCEELQGRLKASRSRVADLEKEVVSLKHNRAKLEEALSCQSEINNIEKQYQELKDKSEEDFQELLQFREKVNVKTKENADLQQEVEGLKHKLSVTATKLEQLTANGTEELSSQTEGLSQQVVALESHISSLNQQLKAMTAERDQTTIHYQQVVQQLNAQLANLATKEESTRAENDNLIVREQNLVKHIGALEKQLQNTQNIPIDNQNQMKNEISEKEQVLNSLRKEYIDLCERLKLVNEAKECLEKELESKSTIIEELHEAVERLQNNQPDNAKLLAAMESDKVAASIAVAQNKELKKQLEVMQLALEETNKEKLELIRQLETNQHRDEERTLKLAELPLLYETISGKDNEIHQLQEELSHVQKQILQQNQLADRLRHFEAQQSGSVALQTELQESHNKIRELQEQLQTMLKTPNESTYSNQDAISDHVEDNNDTNLCHNGNHSSLDKDVALKCLEDKCTRTMNIIANLTEEKQSLEHLVTQLQGETETIGEYIALYQHQRGILQQRTLEKDEQLKRLVEDREKVHVKLDLLNGLIQKWMQEKGPPSMLDGVEHHDNLERACEEHFKSADPVQNEDQEAEEEDDVTKEIEVNETNTAKQIMVLLSEIKSSNLVQPSDCSDNFHPCPWCYGRLETV